MHVRILQEAAERVAERNDVDMIRTRSANSQGVCRDNCQRGNDAEIDEEDCDEHSSFMKDVHENFFALKAREKVARGKREARRPWITLV